MIRTLLKYLVYIVMAIGIFYLIAFIILIYIGPITTLRVKHHLKSHPTNIVVSLTTTPYRIDTIKPVLDGIARQSIKPNKIYVNIPWSFKRDNSKYVIPKWLKSYPNIIINRTKDYGPATKLIATLEKEHDPETIIITFDDDTVYQKQAVRDLVQQYLFDSQSKNAVITGFGLNLLFFQDLEIYKRSIMLGGDRSLIVIGASGVAYKRKFFKNDIFKLTEDVPTSCFLSDDLMISGYLLANRIKIIKASGVVFNGVFSQMLKHLDSSYEIDALSNGANKVGTGSNDSNYANCMIFLDKNKSIYSKSIFTESKNILQITNMKLLHTIISNVYYQYYLTGCLRFIPFLNKIATKTLI